MTLEKSGEVLGERESLQAEIKHWRKILTIAVVAIPVFYVILLAPGSDGITRTPEVLGQFGDYFGGLLNPLIAGAAFYWLTQSVRLQKQELEETRRELRASAKAQADMAASQRATVQLHAMTELLRSTENQIEFISRVIGELDETKPDHSFVYRGKTHKREAKDALKSELLNDLDSHEESAAGYRDSIRNSHLMRNAVVGHAAMSE